MQHGRAQLKDWIARRTFNQREAAEFFGMDFTMLNQILSGRRTPGLTTALVIERHTGIPVEAWVPTPVGEVEATPSGRTRNR